MKNMKSKKVISLMMTMTMLAAMTTSTAYASGNTTVTDDTTGTTKVNLQVNASDQEAISFEITEKILLTNSIADDADPTDLTGNNLVVTSKMVNTNLSIDGIKGGIASSATGWSLIPMTNESDEAVDFSAKLRGTKELGLAIQGTGETSASDLGKASNNTYVPTSQTLGAGASLTYTITGKAPLVSSDMTETQIAELVVTVSLDDASYVAPTTTETGNN